MICLLWAQLDPAAAQVYKWVDEKGVTHYGERAPQGTKAKEVEQRLANPGPASGTAAPQDWKEKEAEFKRRRIDAERTDAKQKQNQEAMERACAQARNRLAVANSGRRLFRLNDKGERTYVGDEERNAAIAQAEQAVAQNCR